MGKSLLGQLDSVLTGLAERNIDRKRPWQNRHLDEVYTRAREVEDAIKAGRTIQEIAAELADFDMAHMILASESHMDGEPIEVSEENYVKFKALIESMKDEIQCDKDDMPVMTDANVIRALRVVAQNSGRYVSGKNRRMKDILNKGEGNCSARTKFISSAIKELFPGLEIYLDQWVYTDRDFGHVFPVVRLPESGEFYKVDMDNRSNIHIERFREGLLTFVTADYIYMV